MNDGISIEGPLDIDVAAIARINEAQFRGNRGSIPHAKKWISRLKSSFPIYQYYVLLVHGRVAGYVGWQLHGGFLREEPPVELEQIAFAQEFQGKGLALRLIEKSFKMVAEFLHQESPLAQQAVSFVWTYEDNAPALKMYRKWFNGEVRGTRNLYGKVEVMLSRIVPLAAE